MSTPSSSSSSSAAAALRSKQSKKRQTLIARCPIHRSAHLVEDSKAGDVVCSRCGRVVGDRVIDVGSEWRSFGNSDKSKDSKDRSRVGLEENPLLDGDQGLAIAPIPNKPHANVSWTRVQATINSGGSQATLKKVFRKIDDLGEKLSLSERVKVRLGSPVVTTPFRST